jgi:UDP-N-acetylmuramoyl-tripeptide--D-alanyl-D-alanine ligase
VVVSVRELIRATGGQSLAGDESAGFPRVVIDSRRVAEGDLFFAIQGPRHDGHDFVDEALGAGAGGAVVSRAPERTLPPGRVVVEVEDTTRALGDLAAAIRRREKLTVVGVTGSAGKSTTKELTRAALAADRPAAANPGNLNNLWGLPLSLLNLPEGTRAAVLEMGMSAPGEIARLTEIADPDVGVITNVGHAHLEFFEDVEAIGRAKGELFAGMRPEGTAVVNADDPRVGRLAEGFPGRKLSFSVSGAPADLAAGELRADLVEGASFVLDGRAVRLGLSGEHAVANALAALAAAEAAGVEREAALAALEAVRPLPGRGRVERLEGGTVLVDETYNASPDAVAAVLRSLAATSWEGRKLLVLGDMLELGERAASLHREAVLQARGAGVDLLVTVGPLSGAACSQAGEMEARSFADSAEAAEAAERIVRGGDLVVVKGSRGMAMERFAEALRRGGEEGG